MIRTLTTAGCVLPILLFGAIAVQARAGLARIAVAARGDNANLADAARIHVEDALLEAGIDAVEPTLGAEAEFVALLSVSVADMPARDGRVFRSASIRYRVLDVASGGVVAASTARESGWGLTADEAADTGVKYAAQKAVRDIKPKVIRQLAKFADYAVMLSIEVHDTRADAVSRALLTRLERVDGVAAVHRLPAGADAWELRLFSAADTGTLSSRVEAVLAETQMQGQVAGGRIVLTGQPLRPGADAVRIACLAVANQTGQGQFDSWTASLPNLVQQSLVQRPNVRVIERRRVADVVDEVELAQVFGDDAARRRVGEVVGADELMLGELTLDPGGDLVLALRSVRVPDGSVVQIVRVRGSAADIRAFEELVRRKIYSPPMTITEQLLSESR